MYDIIPDIHGQSGTLRAALARLGYAERKGAWRHGDAGRRAVFLGDFIDRGPDNAGVIDIVRRMIDAGSALAVMGNHELNAIHFHTRHPESGAPLRRHSEKNLRQHATFLGDFPLGTARTADAIGWMRTLPLFIELDGFRVVHACWNDRVIGRLRTIARDGVLDEDQLTRAADPADRIFELVEVTTKGPEVDLPEGASYVDGNGTTRTKVRVQWWNRSARTWPEIAISVPDPRSLPTGPAPAGLAGETYPGAALPVFFGHYWLRGTPALQGANVLCLDYSAGAGGPLVSYQVADGQAPLSVDRLTVHPADG